MSSQTSFSATLGGYPEFIKTEQSPLLHNHSREGKTAWEPMSHTLTAEDVKDAVRREDPDFEDPHPVGGIKLKPEPESYTSGCFGGSTVDPPPPQPALCRLTEEEHAAMVANKVTVKKAHIIVNPFSGNGKGAKSLEIVKKVCNQNHVQIEVHQTKRAQHATELAATLDLSDADALIAIGGDGTFNEVIAGYMTREWPETKGNKDTRVPLGLVPGGTGNSVCTTFGLLDVAEATKNICKGYVRGIDLGKVTCPKPDNAEETMTRYMINTLGWGLGVDANLTAEEIRCCGPMRYDVGAVWNIIKNPQKVLHATVDGENIDGEYAVIMIQNNIHAGSNMRIAPFAKADDGLIDILFSKQEGRGPLIHMFDELKRDGAHCYLDTVDYRQFKKLRIDSEPYSLINVDGENVPGTPMELECLKRVLPIFYTLQKKEE